MYVLMVMNSHAGHLLETDVTFTPIQLFVESVSARLMFFCDAEGGWITRAQHSLQRILGLYTAHV